MNYANADYDSLTYKMASATLTTVSITGGATPKFLGESNLRPTPTTDVLQAIYKTQYWDWGMHATNRNHCVMCVTFSKE